MREIFDKNRPLKADQKGIKNRNCNFINCGFTGVINARTPEFKLVKTWRLYRLKYSNTHVGVLHALFSQKIYHKCLTEGAKYRS